MCDRCIVRQVLAVLLLCGTGVVPSKYTRGEEALKQAMGEKDASLRLVAGVVVTRLVVGGCIRFVFRTVKLCGWCFRWTEYGILGGD